jgi:hypothetical protein
VGFVGAAFLRMAFSGTALMEPVPGLTWQFCV